MNELAREIALALKEASPYSIDGFDVDKAELTIAIITDARERDVQELCRLIEPFIDFSERMTIDGASDLRAALDKITDVKRAEKVSR